MTTKEFIKKSLDRIRDSYPKYDLLYQYKNNSNTHFIKILADDLLKDIGFSELYFEIIDEFDHVNVDSELCIIDNDALIDLDRPSINMPSVVASKGYEEFFEIQDSISLPEVNENKGVLISGAVLLPKDETEISFSGKVFQDSPFLDLANDERKFAMAA